ncbi:YrhK family protein [Salinisphaera sp. Q1T1-3]|uniref:YrhK family protein n=1 Tax=Salinisphaera sp. Q1T1-3 TaxID=2321229 RepID=UPI000E723712|nr:YrhK family protein [Salinisphaera sp. Q1T1-3]RJS93738.1 hypothetical protein D3260_06625 [Salinisphaera sp. Q1T1-3]
MSHVSPDSTRDTAVIHFGREELVIRQRYEIVSIANDVLIGVWFLIGTVFFFYDSLVYWGTWLFLVGSIEMLIRPTIRLVRRVHLQRFHPDQPGAADAGHDF